MLHTNVLRLAADFAFGAGGSGDERCHNAPKVRMGSRATMVLIS